MNVQSRRALFLIALPLLVAFGSCAVGAAWSHGQFAGSRAQDVPVVVCSGDQPVPGGGALRRATTSGGTNCR